MSGWRAEDAVGDGVHVARYTGAHLARSEETAVLRGCSAQSVDLCSGPPAHQARVEELAEGLHVELLVRLEVRQRVVATDR